MHVTKPLVDDPPAGFASEFLSPREFSQLVGLSEATVRRRIKAGQLLSVQPGGPRHLILIRRDTLERSQKSAENIADIDAPLTRSNRLSGPKPKWLRDNNKEL
jgi:excisionase family DNA binding protein